MLFKQIVGQEKAKQRLISSVKTNRVSHAQLFFGPEGCGSLALAIAYAQYINCQDKKDDDSCGVCQSCLKYDKLEHPDFHFMYPVTGSEQGKKRTSKDIITEWRELLLEKNYYITLNDWYEKIKIENKQGIINAEDCNEIIKTLGLKSYESEYKVVIIWMVEKLFHAAGPKLLKIIEEPPDKTLFIMVSENPDLILNTIRSRSQIIKIPKIADDDISDVLKTTFNLAAADSKKISKLANGNYIEALRLLENNQDENFYFTTLKNWMNHCYSLKIAELSNFINDISAIGREKQKAFFSYTLKTFREALVIQHSEHIIRSTGEEYEFIKKLSKFVNSNNAVQLNEDFNKALFHIERNANPKILFTDLSFRLNKLLYPSKIK